MIVEKPWGTYEVLLDVPERGYKVKRIVVYPYQRFSLQYHKKRTEHWSIVSGTGTITINDKDYDVSVGSNWVILPKGLFTEQQQVAQMILYSLKHKLAIVMKTT